MRTRKSIMKQEKFDYEAELTRHMCEGCVSANKRADIHSNMNLRYVCNAYATAPSMYVRADECPRNPRRRQLIKGKVRVGQGKGRSGGNL